MKEHDGQEWRSSSGLRNKSGDYLHGAHDAARLSDKSSSCLPSETLSAHAGSVPGSETIHSAPFATAAPEMNFQSGGIG